MMGAQLAAVADMPQLNPINPVQVLPFRVATFNTHYDNTGLVGEEVVSLMKTEGIEIIGLQELHFLKQRDNVSKVLCGSKVYDCFMPPYTKGGSSPTSYTIAWDSRKFEAAGEGEVIHMTDRIDDPNNPGKYITSRYVSVQELTQKNTGERIVFLNTHTFPGVQTPEGKMRDDTESITVPGYREHMRKLEEKINELTAKDAKVVLMGDFNFSNEGDDGSSEFSPDSLAKKTGLHDAYSVATGNPITHTRADGSKVGIEYVFAGGKLRPIDAYAVEDMHGSDHHPFVAVVAETELTGWAKSKIPALPLSGALAKLALARTRGGSSEGQPNKPMQVAA